MNDFLEFASRGKNAAWRYVVCCVCALLLATAILVLISVILVMLKLLPPDIGSALRHPKDAMIFFLGTGATFAALLAGLIASAAVIQRKRARDIVGNWRWRLFFLGMGIWFAVEFASTASDFLIAPGGFSISVSGATGSLAIFALVGLSIQTFAEEFIFRGYLTQGLLLATRRPLPAAIASGILFGALHIPNGMPEAVNAVVFGIVCALIAIRTGGIAFTYGLHLINNLFGAVAVVSTSDVFAGSPALISQNTPHLLWWDVTFSVLALGGVSWWVLRGPIMVTAQAAADGWMSDAVKSPGARHPIH